MDELVANIVSLSADPSSHEDLLATLKKQCSLLEKSQQTVLANAVATLDPATHSLGMLFLLDAQLKALKGRREDNTVATVSDFLLACSDTQIRLAPETFCTVCRRLKEQVIAMECPFVGVWPLQVAIRKLAQTSESLTPLHADLFQLCLLAKVYNAASPFVDEDIFDVNPAKTSLTPTDLLLYCYYGGMVCTGRKRYTRALELFLQGLTAPTAVSNAITAAIYKKYALVHLIHTGKPAALPNFTATKVKQLVDSECRPYIDVGNAFNSHKMERLNRTLEQHRSSFEQDGNLGLVKHVAVALTKSSIQRLTQTYMTLSLEVFAQNVGLSGAAEAERYILRMVDDGEIHANINARDGMVTFLKDPEAFCSVATAKLIDEHIQKCCDMSTRLQDVHEAVSLDRQYLSKIMMKERSRYDPSDDGTSGHLLYQP